MARPRMWHGAPGAMIPGHLITEPPGAGES